MASRSSSTSDTRTRVPTTRHPAANVQKQAKSDRRVLRTQRQLRDSLVTLILERGWDAVTVRDVCEHADVGRSTFYLHYPDKEGLLLSGFEELHAQMSAYGRDVSQPFAFAEPLMIHALEHEQLFKALVGRQSGQQMQWRFRDVLVTLLSAELTAMKLPASQRRSVARFIAGGFLEALTEALESPGKVDAVAVAARFRRLAAGVVQAA